jgi:hypothetical protein
MYWDHSNLHSPANEGGAGDTAGHKQVQETLEMHTKC